MRILSWNVNGLRRRLEGLQALCDQMAPDILLLQETKVSEAFFPETFFEKNQYFCAHWGQKSYNGVAIASRSPIVDHGPIMLLPDQARGLWARTAQGLFLSVYAPNPRGPEKVRWFEALKVFLVPLKEEFCVVGGDFNVHLDFLGGALCSLEERRGMNALLYGGWTHTQWTEPTLRWTWRDYRAHQDALCLDYLLLSPKALQHWQKGQVEQAWRWLESSSDHVPLWGEL